MADKKDNEPKNVDPDPKQASQLTEDHRDMVTRPVAQNQGITEGNVTATAGAPNLVRDEKDPKNHPQRLSAWDLYVSHTVAPGDTLHSIVTRYYDLDPELDANEIADLVQRLWMINAGVLRDPEAATVGTTVLVPTLKSLPKIDRSKIDAPAQGARLVMPR